MWQRGSHPCEHGPGMSDGMAAPCGRCGTPLGPFDAACPACGAAREVVHSPSFEAFAKTEADVPGSAHAPRPTESSEAETRRKITGDEPAKGPLSPETGGGERVDDSRFKPGERILGHYTVVRQLGRGGMGTVYLARDEVSGQEVAVKALPASLARERDIRERFIQEARALASMDHPNIVPLVTFAQEGEDRFLVMKYVAGEALDARIRRLGVLPPEQARKVLRAMLSALGYAHARGVIHRDVKPSNVLIEGDLDGEHRVFLVDFGIAKKEEGGKKLTQTGMLMGTPQYMSPEQISGHAVDRRSDIYAAGLVLFEMLAGRPPFDGQKTFQVLRAHVEQPVPDVREARGGPLPEDLVALTYLLLRKNPDERPADAHEAIGLLDGTGSFPILRPDERPSTEAPPASRPTTPPTTMMARPLGSEPPTGQVDGRLDDPSFEELAALRPRRGLFAAALAALVAGGTWLGTTRPWEPAAVEGVAAVVDSGNDLAAADDDGDDLTVAVLFVNARDAMERKELDRARVIVDAILEQDPENLKARSLRVDILLTANALDDAEATLAVLDEKLAARPEGDEDLRARAAEQARTLAERRATASRAGSERSRPRDADRDRDRDRPRGGRPSELSDKALRDVTSSTNGRIKLCYEEHVQVRDPRAHGEVVLKVRVSPSGAVDDVIIKSAARPFRGGDFQGCLKKQVQTWRFRPFQGEPDAFVHKFAFRPS